MNRRSQLQKTLVSNFELIRQFEEEVELVLVNFIKDDEGELIDDWINSLDKPANFKYFVSRDLKHWHAPTAKNTAHLQADGRFLINLDCDNFIAKETVEKLLSLNEKELDRTIFSGFTGHLVIKKVKVKPRWKDAIDSLRLRAHMSEAFSRGSYQPRWGRLVIRTVRDSMGTDFNGTYGHIGLPKQVFCLIGGYNQELPAMGGQDKDLMWRAYNLQGMGLLQIPQPKSKWPVENDKSASLQNSVNKGGNWDDINKAATGRALDAIKKREIIANVGLATGVPVVRVW